ncbi:MAG: CHAT domain-containing protein [Bacteroidales bacterium]
MKTEPLHLILFFVLSVLHACTTPSIQVSREQQLGDYHYNQHEYSKAIEHYKKSYIASKSLGNYRNLINEAGMARKIADAYNNSGYFSEAIGYLEQAYLIDSLVNHEEGMFLDLIKTGETYLFKGEIKKGIAAFEKLLDPASGFNSGVKEGKKELLAGIHLNLASAKLVLGKYSEANSHCLQAANIYRSTGNKEKLAESLYIMGTISIDRGDLREGISYLEESAGFSRELNLSFAKQYMVLGDGYANLGKPQDALKFKKLALEQALKSNIKPQIMAMYISLGDIYQTIGNEQAALENYSLAMQVRDGMEVAGAQDAALYQREGNFASALSYYAENESDIGNGNVHLKMAGIHLNEGKLHDAGSNYSQAYQYFYKLGIAEGMAKSLIGLGRIKAGKGDFKACLDRLYRAQLFAFTPETKWNLSLYKGIAFEGLGKTDSAITAYKKAIDIIEEVSNTISIDEIKSGYIEDRMEPYDRLVRILSEEGKTGASFHYSERARARAFLDMIAKKKIAGKPGAPGEIVKEEQELRERLQKLNATLYRDAFATGDDSTRGTREIIMEELQLVQDKYAEVVKEIKLYAPGYANLVKPEPVYISKVQENMETGKAMVIYWIGENHSGAWLLDRETVKYYKLSSDGESIKSLVALCRYHIGVFNQDSAMAYLKELSRAILSPLEEDMDKYKELAIIPHGPLHFIPFQAMVASDGQYMVKKHVINILPSASVYLATRDEALTGSPKLLGMALGNQYLGSFSGLPATLKEVKSISGAFDGSKVLIEEKSTETFFKVNAANYSLLHIATHGYFNEENPLYSFLLFNQTDEDDGLLEVHEIFGLDLEAELAVLSACQTGLGKITRGDEITGLSRAFMYAGTPRLVVSLWSVADESTSFLMQQFYKYLPKNKPAKALQKAQVNTMAKYPNPFHWAPFVLMGND